MASAIAFSVLDRLRAENPTHGPCDERLPRCGNGPVDVGGAAGRRGAVLLMADRLGDVDGRAVGAVDVLAVDVVTNRRRQRLEQARRLVAGPATVVIGRASATRPARRAALRASAAPFDEQRVDAGQARWRSA